MADRRNGFTLIELLVALAVFSLAALALLRLQAVAVRTAADLDTRLWAQFTAQNLMVDIQTAPASPGLGETQGEVRNAGRTWRWHRRVTPAGEGGLIRIDLRVQDSADQAGRAVLSFVRTAQ